ncbi:MULTISPECIES: tyrosine-type recombinase/integrase [Aeromonas]|uniref:tyrosine-type recombinase/integrase n=1 Tax=Aeromonas TaxID=642 RepID=UPI000A531E6A|nr:MULTISPECIES: site-specific integrase [Aeromonas]MEA9426354.1 site-specific integrase [Aeromonas caviae]
MPEQAVAPTVDRTKLEECSSKQRESKDKYERSLTWITYATGRKVGCLSFTKNKVRYRLKIASTDEVSVKEIREQARKLKAEFVLDPVGFNQIYLSSLSVEQFIHDKYLPAVRATHRSHKTIESRVKPIVAALGHKPLNRVTRFDIEDFLTASNKTRSVATRNRYLAQVKAIMSFALERGIIKSSPAAGIPAKHEAVLPPKGLPDEVVNKVVHRLMKDIDDEKARLLLFLFATGCRLGEARALQLQDCNINQQIAYLPTSKSGRERLIPLNHFALELIQLQFQRHGTTGLLFRGQDGVSQISEPRRYWYRVCNDCGLSGVRMHDARHTVATSLLNQGCSLDVLQKVLGHSSPKMTERYARLHDTTLVKAVNELHTLWDLPRITC